MAEDARFCYFDFEKRKQKNLQPFLQQKHIENLS